MRGRSLVLFLILAGCGGDGVAGHLADAPPASDAPLADTPPADMPDAGPSSYDPTGGIVTSGEHGGPGCPDSDATTFTLAAGAVTSRPFAGIVTGAAGSGVFYVRGTGNQELFGTIPTDANGNYNVTVPLFCGAQLVKLHWTNATCAYDIVYDVTTDTCTDRDIRITVGWDDIGLDWELHLIKPGGKINDNATDCTWTSCIGTAPDWGVIGSTADDPSKDVDNTGPYGPENILLSGPEVGTYTVMVEHWNGNGSPLSDGTVILNVAGKPAVVQRVMDLAPYHVWTAATITFPGGVVTPSSAVYDCSANWSGGCRDSIP
jgi:hypothetical protein